MNLFDTILKLEKYERTYLKKILKDVEPLSVEESATKKQVELDHRKQSVNMLNFWPMALWTTSMYSYKRKKRERV